MAYLHVTNENMFVFAGNAVPRTTLHTDQVVIVLTNVNTNGGKPNVKQKPNGQKNKHSLVLIRVTIDAALRPRRAGVNPSCAYHA